MYTYRVNHIPKTTPHNRRPGRAMQPEYLTIHSTANPNSTAQNERDWLTNPSNTRTASWHIAVDDKEVIEAIPLNEMALHAGDGGNGTGNTKSIGIEICESGDRTNTIQNAAELVAKMLKERNWGVDRLRRHYDWSGKNCPRILADNNWKGWNDFKLAVQKELDKLNNSNKVKVQINGKIHYIDGFLKDGTNYCSIRQIAEVLGKKVEWDNKNKVVLIK